MIDNQRIDCTAVFLHFPWKKLTINVLSEKNGKFIEEIFIRKKELELKKFLGEKYNKFSLRKLTVGVCSMTIGSFFLVSTVQPEDYVVKAADNAIVHYKYVEKKILLIKKRN